METTSHADKTPLPTRRPRIYMWQNLMCLTYLLVFRRMERFFLRSGCEIVRRPDRADWILLGGCGAFYYQIDHFFEELDRLAGLDARIVVYGCLPKVSPDRYAQAKGAVAFYIDTRRPDEVERIVPEPAVRWADVPEADGFRLVDYRRYDPAKRYVVVQEGCSAKCVFCPHIVGIGPQKSVPRRQVVARIRRLLDLGADTILLEGRDTGSWGADLTPPQTFPDLLGDVLAIDGGFSLHVNQLGANWVIRYPDRLLELLLDPKVVDIHIPIQTTSDRLLRLMGREEGVVGLRDFLAALRKRAGRPVLRTDMLIGFPTETEAEFTDTLHFVNAYFDEVAYYGFELHPNTEVAHMGLAFLDQATIDDRVRRANLFIRSNPHLVSHRGGQVPQTMIAREQHKLALNRA